MACLDLLQAREDGRLGWLRLGLRVDTAASVTGTAAAMPKDGGGMPSSMRLRKNCSGVHIAINSLASYATPRAYLLSNLALNGVPMQQVHVFLGDSPKESASAVNGGRYVDETSGAWHYRVPHNSVDFTAMIHIAENAELFSAVKQWFYMHDTSSVGPSFWSNATRWCASGLPACALPLTRWNPTSSMGLYDADFLRSPAAVGNISALKNTRGLSGMRWKQRGVGWEDKLFKVCDAMSPDAPIRRFSRRCENKTLGRRTCMCSQLIVSSPVRVYGAESTPRQVWRFDCADVKKYKANYVRNQNKDGKMIIAP